MTETLQSRLAPGAGSGIYRLKGRPAAGTLAALAAAAGWAFLHVDAAEVQDKAGFLAAAARDLSFPDWAGRNWDAFEELVNDLSWLPAAQGRLLLVDGLSRFAAHEARDVRTALAILDSAVAHRRAGADAPLVIVVRGGGRAAGHLPALAVEPPASDG